MAIVEGGHDDLMQLWAVITELGEQLSQNRSMSVSLYALAGKVKVIRILEGIYDIFLLTLSLATSCQFTDRFRSSSVCLLLGVPFIVSDATNNDRNNLDKTSGTLWHMSCIRCR